MMRHNSQSTVHLFGGKMASAEELETYLTGFYDEDGEYLASAFEHDFGLDLDPDFLEVEWFEQAGSDLQELLTGFSYDNQIKSQVPESLSVPVNSLVLVYEVDSEPSLVSDNQLTYLGSASYIRD